MLFGRIVSGELAAGTRLKEIALAEEFGLSRTPVRDVLQPLTELRDRIRQVGQGRDLDEQAGNRLNFVPGVSHRVDDFHVSGVRGAGLRLVLDDLD